MNQRQFKKLCKQAAEIIDANQPSMAKIRFASNDMEPEPPEITCAYNWERKCLHGYKGRIVKEPELFPTGIVGYGETTGYYEPEWSDKSALCILIDMVSEEFTDWSETNEDGWPECKMSEKMKRSPRKLIQFAKNHKFKPYHGVH